MSAVSKNVTPASRAAATIASTAGCCAIRPKGRHPMPTTETSTPLSPGRVRYSIGAALLVRRELAGTAGHRHEPGQQCQGDQHPGVLQDQSETGDVVLLVVAVRRHPDQSRAEEGDG